MTVYGAFVVEQPTWRKPRVGGTMAFLVRVLLAAVVWTSSGCAVLAVATTKNEVLDERRLTMKTTSRAANVDADRCYVDEQVELTRKAHVASIFGVGGAAEALLAALVVSAPGMALYMLPLIADGVVSFIYWKARDRKNRKTVRWKETLETSYCDSKKPSAIASRDTSTALEPPPRGPASRDSDLDGIKDDRDACALGPEDADGYMDEDGCPDDDNDRDGILDAADGCPTEPEDQDGHEDSNGCPDPDNDGDGIVDARDRCVNAAEDKDGFEDDDGCVDHDNDKDGIADVSDKCANIAEDRDGNQDDDGCIDPDDDNDGVADTADKCPAQLETKNGFQDADGCADTVPRALARSVGVVRGVRFAPSSNELAGGPNPALDRIANMMLKNPDLRIAIELHARIQAANPRPASREGVQANAERLRDYLVKKGVAAERVIAVGFDDSLKAPRVELSLISDLVPPRRPGTVP